MITMRQIDGDRPRWARMPRGGLPLALVSLSLVVAASSASAGPFFRGREGTPAPGRPRVIEHSHARAGNPLCVSPHATPTNGPGYLGYYVGGGTACRGCSRGHEEGTWGWDYEGVHLPRRVWLSWSHGRRYQGGTGSYRTDGASLPGQAGHGTPTPAHAGP